MTIKDEFAFINKIKPKTSHSQHLITGIGDDAALIRPMDEMDQIICMDTMVEGIHFTKDTMSPNDIGYKALAVNISDIAAMGGKPLYYLVSIAVPKKWSQNELIAIYDGMKELSDTYKIDLIGGDTVSSPDTLMITVTVLGQIQRGKQLLRSNARVGDVVFVTGTIGDSAAGLELILNRSRNHSFIENEEYLVRRHQHPTPRVEIGHALTLLDRVSLNDISDGLASETNEIAESSKVNLVIDETKLSLSSALLHYNKSRALEWALYGGEDFELIGTMAPETWGQFENKIHKLGIAITVIGSVQEGKGEVFLLKNGELIPLEKKGYNHFK